VGAYRDETGNSCRVRPCSRDWLKAVVESAPICFVLVCDTGFSASQSPSSLCESGFSAVICFAYYCATLASGLLSWLPGFSAAVLSMRVGLLRPNTRSCIGVYHDIVRLPRHRTLPTSRSSPSTTARHWPPGFSAGFCASQLPSSVCESGLSAVPPRGFTLSNSGRVHSSGRVRSHLLRTCVRH